jgi:glutamate-1-semialdehyde 2,1-aminomutase
LQRGVFLPPSQFEAAFLSVAHSDEVLAQVAEAMRQAMRQVAESE